MADLGGAGFKTRPFFYSFVPLFEKEGLGEIFCDNKSVPFSVFTAYFSYTPMDYRVRGLRWKADLDCYGLHGRR